jgi:exopolyphosphatase/guanosine-5'-triphosphate,3'-diphosphate pyrophosphatase
MPSATQTLPPFDSSFAPQPQLLDAVPPSDRIAVIDIGSNSVRLVIYGKNGRYPTPLFDERSNCQLGARLDETGNLVQDRIEAALETITRFAAIIKAMHVSACYPIATAAVRRAKNGAAFYLPAQAILGMPIHILSQQEEANYVSRGLTLNIPDADGLVADLGGGSIEIVALDKGNITHGVSHNFGHLSDVDEAEVMQAFENTAWIAARRAKRLYGVGGSFRAFGAAFFDRVSYPLPVLHGTKIKSDFMRGLCDELTTTPPNMRGVPLSRQHSMPMAAKIVRALLQVSGVGQLIVSGTSIRDGVIAVNELNDAQRADFLMAISQEIAEASGRFVGVSDALKVFLQPLMKIDPTPGFSRLVEVACNLADMCWHEHSDMRGDLAARRVLGLPVNCMTHKERVWLGVALYHRYVGTKQNKPRPEELDNLLGAEFRGRAITVGLGLRFALIFTAGTKEYLNDIRLDLDDRDMTLYVNQHARPLFDGACANRFTALANSAGLHPKVVFE